MSIQYPKKCSIGQLKTPFNALDNLSNKLGGPRIWIKRDDMTGFASGGNKVRKLEYLLEDAKAKGCDTLVTQGAFQSNHCRATALLGNKMGFKTSLLLLGDLSLIADNKVPDSNHFISRLTGVEVTYYDMQTYVGKLDDIMEEKIAALVKIGHKPYKIPAGATSPLGLWGYIECAKELKADFERENINPGYIVHATGTSGTQAGLTLGKQIYDLDAEILGVAVWQNSTHFENITRRIMIEWQKEFGIDIKVDSLPINTLDQYTGQGYSDPDPEVFETVRMVVEQEAILLDPVYTGRAFHGMLEAIKKGSFSDASDIVFIHTGGAFGLLAQRNNFTLDNSNIKVYR